MIRSNLIPIDDMQKRGNIVGAPTLLIAAARMLPNVQPEDERIGERDEHLRSCSEIDREPEARNSGVLGPNLLR